PPTPRLPADPVGAAYPPPDPRIQLRQHSRGFAETKIATPPSQVLRQHLDSLLHTLPLLPSRDFPDLVLEAFPCLRRDPPLRFGSARETKSQKFSLLRFCHRAF